MKLNQFLLMCCLGAMTCTANDLRDNDLLNFLALPLKILTNIAALSDAETNLALRATCSLTKDCIDKIYTLPLEKNFNAFTETFEAEFEGLPLGYKKSLIDNIATELLHKGGCFFVPQTSYLEPYLSKNCMRISLYPYLKEDKAWTHKLFCTLFGKQMPTENADLALKLLMACLPITHVYGAPEPSQSSEIIQQFKEVHHETLIEALKKLKAEHSYFLVSIDQDKQRLKTKPHFIVVNQSNTDAFEHLNQEGYLPKDHPHTIVYNIDQEDATFPDRMHNIGKLILTNTSNNCTSIENFSLDRCTNLTSLDMRRLSNLTSIGDYFLEGCTNLTSLNMGELSNLTSIGDHFLDGCTNLTSLDMGELSNLTSIGDYFLEGCTNLTYLNMRGLSNLASIGDGFLDECANLTCLNMQELSNITSIGDYFLDGCTNLTSLDMGELSNLTFIGDHFLDGCTNLTSLDMGELSNLTFIGRYFLKKCTNLSSLNIEQLPPQVLTLLRSRMMPYHFHLLDQGKTG